MNLRLDTRFEEMCLVVKVAVTMPTKVRIKIYDEQKPKIVFTDRYKTVNGDYTFYVRMPITSKSVIISVYDDIKGNSPQSQDPNIKVVSVDKTPLQKRIDVVDIHNPTIANFIDFAQRFCFNAPYLEANKSYQSDNGGFMIEYLPTIVDSRGRELTTPARISRMTGRIQVSKKQFDNYTIPMRFAILCHEFSHFYVNENMSDENEADINGLLIYLGLGYPRIEACEAFLEVFEHYPSQENKVRYDKIKKMENENNLILQNQKYSSMIRPYVGASIINPFILDVVEKLGKYALIYDYKVINPYFGERDNFLRSIPLLPLSSPLKKTLVPENAPPFYYNFVPQISDTQALEMAKREQAIALAMQNVAITPREAIMPSVSYTVNPNPQVGTFSKGNIVNVLRFDGYYAIIQNPNYVEPDTTAPKVSFFTSLVGDMRNQKEFKIPKEYLSKVDDNTPVTISTGINFGANPKPQPIFNIPLPKLPNYQIIPELDNEVVLEQNANFVLSKDFQYDRTYTQGKPLYELGGAGRLQFEQKANYKTLPIGTKVTGRLIRRRSNSAYKVVYGVTQPPSYNDFLDVKGYGEKGRIEIPIEYLTREVENIISTDTRTPASVIALVDKKTGKCNETGTIRTMNYNPCRVSAIKGQIYNGYIVGNNFFDGKDAYLTVNEYQIIPQNNGTIVPVKNNNKNLLMIAGAFLAGYIIFGNSKSSN